MRILFVCTGNTCRSAIAEALLRAMVEKLELEDIEVSSAGIYASDGMPASFGAISALDERGIDLYTHRATRLSKDRIEEADLILCMERAHVRGVLSIDFGENVKKKTHALMAFATGREEDIQDPFGGDAGVYEETVRRLELALAAALVKLYPEKREQIQKALEEEI